MFLILQEVLPEQLRSFERNKRLLTHEFNQFDLTLIMETVEVTRFAIKYHPPILVIEFKRNEQLYLKKIKLKMKNEMVILLLSFFC